MPPETYRTIVLVSRYLFAFFALMLLLFAFSWVRSEGKKRRERFRNLPGAGTVGELLVLSGSEELPADTWFPVPREGVLGSLRTCDLVVPCPGVEGRHLDFSWQDGVGLVLRPRGKCEVLVDGVPVSRRSGAEAPPLVHGSCLQVGSALLRLQLFAALNHTNRAFAPAGAEQVFPAGNGQPFSPEAGPAAVTGDQLPLQMPGQTAAIIDAGMPPCPLVPEQAPVTEQEAFPASLTEIPINAYKRPPSGETDPGLENRKPETQPDPRRRRRTERWKEDFSE